MHIFGLTRGSAVVTVAVAWSGDDGGGSGVASYDLDVSADGDPWEPLLTNTQSTSYQYTGQPGHRYTFRVTATDHVGNVGEDEAETRVAAVTKYYYFGGRRVAMRSSDGVYYLHADHLGSTSLTTDGSGEVVARQLYHPFGTVRWSEGTLPTDFGFTGQRHDGTGLVFMHARYYHPYLGRFISADSIVPEPGNPQAWNRYSYVYNNPLKYTDPSGHGIEDLFEWFVEKATEWMEGASGKSRRPGSGGGKRGFGPEPEKHPIQQISDDSTLLLQSASDNLTYLLNSAASNIFGGSPDVNLPTVTGDSFELPNVTIDVDFDIDWTGAALDALGFAIGIVEAGGSLPATVAGTFVGITELAMTTKQMIKGEADWTDFGLDLAGLIPIFRSVPDAIDLIQNFAPDIDIEIGR
jgi:RHS repeat-associated protein